MLAHLTPFEISRDNPWYDSYSNVSLQYVPIKPFLYPACLVSSANVISEGGRPHDDAIHVFTRIIPLGAIPDDSKRKWSESGKGGHWRT